MRFLFMCLLGLGLCAVASAQPPPPPPPLWTLPNPQFTNLITPTDFQKAPWVISVKGSYDKINCAFPPGGVVVEITEDKAGGMVVFTKAVIAANGVFSAGSMVQTLPAGRYIVRVYDTGFPMAPVQVLSTTLVLSP